jgi:hypothetical protein
MLYKCLVPVTAGSGGVEGSRCSLVMLSMHMHSSSSSSSSSTCTAIHGVGVLAMCHATEVVVIRLHVM